MYTCLLVLRAVVQYLVFLTVSGHVGVKSRGCNAAWQQQTPSKEIRICETEPLEAYPMNGARSIRYGACSNETGKLANIIVIDRNYFDLLAQGAEKTRKLKLSNCVSLSLNIHALKWIDGCVRGETAGTVPPRFTHRAPPSWCV